MPIRCGLDRCDFRKWCRYDTWLIEQAAFVLLGKEPPSIGQIQGDEPSDGWYIPDEFGYIFDLLLNSVQINCNMLSPILSGTGRKKQWHVRPRNVLAWANRKNLDVPEELEKIITEQIERELKPCRFERWVGLDSWALAQAGFILHGLEPQPLEWGKIYAPESVLATIDFLRNSAETGEIKHEWRSEYGRDILWFRPAAVIAWAKQKNIALPEKLDGFLVAQKENFLGWEGFDPDSATYPPELDIAFQAWRWASSNTNPESKSPKQLILGWLNENYSSLDTNAKERIATICNWNKKGGRTRQS